MKNNFQRKPFLRDDMLNEHYDKLINIESQINEQLVDFEYFDGIDFCDVGARGIQVRGFHKEIKGYSYGNQITIEYDFSNCDEIVELFVSMWKSEDTPEKIKRYNSFLEAGERWGWD